MPLRIASSARFELGLDHPRANEAPSTHSAEPPDAGPKREPLRRLAPPRRPPQRQRRTISAGRPTPAEKPNRRSFARPTVILRVRFRSRASSNWFVAARGSFGIRNDRGSTLVLPPGMKPRRRLDGAPLSTSLKPPSPEKTNIASKPDVAMSLVRFVHSPAQQLLNTSRSATRSTASVTLSSDSGVTRLAAGLASRASLGRCATPCAVTAATGPLGRPASQPRPNP